jgi:phosphatidylglycerol lysyltransferase
MGMAPLAGVGEEPGSSHKERALHFLYEHLNTIFSYKGLKSYKDKFEPAWEDRFFVYQEGPFHLTRIILAFAQIIEKSPKRRERSEGDW